MKQLLAERTKEEELEVGMEKMKISTEKMEWKNRLLLDSDDDSDPERDPEDPLAVLAQGLVPPTSSRAQSKDRREDRMSNFVGSRPEVEKFATAQASRGDLGSTPQNRFIPHSSVKQLALDPELRHRLGAGGTSTSPNPPAHSPSPKPGTPNMPMSLNYTNTTSCLLTLEDSLRLQQEQEKRIREAQASITSYSDFHPIGERRMLKEWGIYVLLSMTDACLRPKPPDGLSPVPTYCQQGPHERRRCRSAGWQIYRVQNRWRGERGR